MCATDALNSTGATGYIGGDALYALYNKHPDYEYAALIRTEEKASAVKKAFPSLRAVIGGLDDSDLLKQEASKADVVLRESSGSVLSWVLLTRRHTLPMPLTMKVLPKQLLLDLSKVTPKRVLASGFTPAVPVFSPGRTPTAVAWGKPLTISITIGTALTN